MNPNSAFPRLLFAAIACMALASPLTGTRLPNGLGAPDCIVGRLPK
jgi:hypothetical protein